METRSNVGVGELVVYRGSIYRVLISQEKKQEILPPVRNLFPKEEHITSIILTAQLICTLSGAKPERKQKIRVNIDLVERLVDTQHRYQRELEKIQSTLAVMQQTINDSKE